MNNKAWVFDEKIYEANSNWVRGGKTYTVRYKITRWLFNGDPMFTKDRVLRMDTIYGRIRRLDRNKYLPDGSSNPFYYKN